MAYIRRNVWELGGTWAAPVLWYARAVKAMKARPIAEPTSWKFFAAIHGFHEDFWKDLGYLDATDTLPSDATRKIYWEQCQHGGWYFLPWHRGYLLALEKILREEIRKLDAEAAETWALPYWNYFKSGQNTLPPEFASPDWPDGTGDNPLFVQQRYGPFDDGNVFVPLDANVIDADALQDDDFTAGPSGMPSGFGGVDTGFEPSGGTMVGIEAQPHNTVHGLVGGPNEEKPGLMSYSQSAALDPIFWLHHANIDRLWEVWRRDTTEPHADPTEDKWLQGPGFIGDRAFAMPKPDGTQGDLIPADVTDLTTLGYTYDDFGAPAAAPRRRVRRGRRGPGLEARDTAGAADMVKKVELLGSTQESIDVVGTGTQTSLRLDQPVRAAVPFGLESTGEGPEHRVFLRLEDIRGVADGTVVQIFVNDVSAGSVSLFGARRASREHGTGLNVVLEISDAIDKLHLDDALTADALQVRIEPVTPVEEKAAVTIGQIKIFRQES